MRAAAGPLSRETFCLSPPDSCLTYPAEFDSGRDSGRRPKVGQGVRDRHGDPAARGHVVRSVCRGRGDVLAALRLQLRPRAHATASWGKHVLAARALEVRTCARENGNAKERDKSGCLMCVCY